MSCEESITRFQGPHRFLSNFWIEPDGTHVEGEYQAAKTDPPTAEIRALTPAQAKRWGKRAKLRSDWLYVRVGIMRSLVRQKFLDHEELRKKLLETGSAHLEEGNSWGDKFWGTHNGYGENHLGFILMEVREELRQKFPLTN